MYVLLVLNHMLLYLRMGIKARHLKQTPQAAREAWLGELHVLSTPFHTAASVLFIEVCVAPAAHAQAGAMDGV
jgi:hypothetical protein